MKFNVEGMTCRHCIGSISKAIHALDPHARVDVDVGAGTVTIGGRVDPEVAIAAIEADGYRVVPAQAASKSCCGCC